MSNCFLFIMSLFLFVGKTQSVSFKRCFWICYQSELECYCSQLTLRYLLKAHIISFGPLICLLLVMVDKFINLCVLTDKLGCCLSIPLMETNG